jgi:hypothetical protein
MSTRDWSPANSSLLAILAHSCMTGRPSEPITSAESGGDIKSAAGQFMMRRCWSHVSCVWTSLQVEHQGQYSIEYLCRANKFCQRTGTTRSTLVLALTPLPCLVVVLAIECIPLEDLAMGVERALPFLIRAFLMMLIVDFLVLHQLRHMIPTLPTSNIILIALSAFSSLGAVVAVFGMAKTIGFLMPFTSLLAAPVTEGLLGYSDHAPMRCWCASFALTLPSGSICSTTSRWGLHRSP